MAVGVVTTPKTLTECLVGPSHPAPSVHRLPLPSIAAVESEKNVATYALASGGRVVSADSLSSIIRKGSVHPYSPEYTAETGLWGFGQLCVTAAHLEPPGTCAIRAPHYPTGPHR